jgi:Raf kinase inhibitor-like YbhB/YbcL family protein
LRHHCSGRALLKKACYSILGGWCAVIFFIIASAVIINGGVAAGDKGGVFRLKSFAARYGIGLPSVARDREFVLSSENLRRAKSLGGDEVQSGPQSSHDFFDELFALTAKFRGTKVEIAGNDEIFVWDPSIGCSSPKDTRFVKPSPQLSWDNPPKGTRSFDLVFEDLGPNGTGEGTGANWVHWRVEGIPGSARSLVRGASGHVQRMHGGREDRNSWNRPGYGGPCPPDPPHVYRLTIRARPSGKTASLEGQFRRDAPVVSLDTENEARKRVAEAERLAKQELRRAHGSQH